MPFSRYVRITPLMNTGSNDDIELSAFRLFSGDNQVDLSTSTVRLGFQPVSGNGSIVLRDTIVLGEALVIPKVLAQGNSSIYIDLGVPTGFDAFQVGFGSSQDKSLTKLRIEYSDDGLFYKSMDEIALDVRLKYRNPWTFSGLTANAKTGFPGFINRQNFYRDVQANYDILNKLAPVRFQNTYIDPAKRRVFSKNADRSFNNGDGSNGSIFFLPISSYLKRGKYYLEVSSDTGVNGYGTDTSIYISTMLTTISNTPTQAYFARNALFSASTAYSGTREPNGQFNIDRNIIGGPVPPDYDIRATSKKGLLCGITIDTVTGVIRVVNSPFTPDFQFNANTLVPYFANTPNTEDSRHYFFLWTAGPHDATNTDYTFNFGQTPFIGTVPEGFDDRIGQRWEMEIDPTYNTKHAVMNFDDSLNVKTAAEARTVEDYNNFPDTSHKNDYVFSPELKYYVKGKVTDVNGKFFKRTMLLLSYPEMVQLRSSSSSTEDGTYEFLHLENRLYAVVSQDSFNNGFQDEILGPLRPTLMDPTK